MKEVGTRITRSESSGREREDRIRAKDGEVKVDPGTQWVIVINTFCCFFLFFVLLVGVISMGLESREGRKAT